LIKAPFKLAPLKDLPKIFELMGMCFRSLYWVWVLMISRTRKDCRSVCSRNARVRWGHSISLPRQNVWCGHGSLGVSVRGRGSVWFFPLLLGISISSWNVRNLTLFS
jgi:hypothetical protein